MQPSKRLDNMFIGLNTSAYWLIGYGSVYYMCLCLKICRRDAVLSLLTFLFIRGISAIPLQPGAFDGAFPIAFILHSANTLWQCFIFLVSSVDCLLLSYASQLL